MAHDTFLKQWTSGETPAAQTDAKGHEFSIYVPVVMATLKEIGAQNLVDVEADEGVLSVAFCQQTPQGHSTFVLISDRDDPKGELRGMTKNITRDFNEKGRVRLVTGLEEVADASADAILFINILGCQGALENVEAKIASAERIVRPGGHSIIITPNATGGRFSSYECALRSGKPRHGDVYDFQMHGEPEPFVNLLTTQQGLKQAFSRHGFGYVRGTAIADRPYVGNNNYASERPAFFQYLFQRNLG